MSDEEKRELVARAGAERSYVIEDDAYSETWFSGETVRPLVADERGRVFHVGTFSKTLCPGLRIGWLVPPPSLARRALREKQRMDLQANGLAQALLVEYLKSGHFEAHKRRARESYRRKARRLMTSVRRHLPELRFVPPGGGFSLWLESELELDDEQLLKAAVAHGVSFDPGRLFRVSAGRLALRLCYSAVHERDIDEGVQRLKRALRSCLDAATAPSRRTSPRASASKAS
jgi:2-aminoadipate transaminase